MVKVRACTDLAPTRALTMPASLERQVQAPEQLIGSAIWAAQRGRTHSCTTPLSPSHSSTLPLPGLFWESDPAAPWSCQSNIEGQGHTARTVLGQECSPSSQQCREVWA
jgi:hypothetical protein